MTEAVRLDVLAAALARRAMPFSAESALFILLQAVEAMGDRPMALTPDAITVGPDGAVALPSDEPEALTAEAVESVAAVLEAVLVPMPGGVIEFTARARAGEFGTLAALHSELEALLVPLNRSAARRMLGRLTREHTRSTDAAHDAAHHPGADPGDDAGAAHDAMVDGGASALLASAEPAADAGSPTAVAAVIEGSARSGGNGPADTEPDGDVMNRWDQDDAARRAKNAGSSGGGMFLLLVALAAMVAAGIFLAHRLRLV